MDYFVTRVAAAVVAVTGLAVPSTGAAQQSDLRMVIANGVACRAQPEVGAGVERRYSVGEVFNASDQAVDGEGTWYLDQSRGGNQGCWIYGPLTVALDRVDPVPALLAAADHILARKDEVPFVEYVAVDNVLTQMPARAHGRPAIEDSPLLQLRRLQVIDRALAAPDANRWAVADDPLKAAWMHAHADLVQPFEPAGRWLMDAEVYWRLFEEHRGSEAAEMIAWAAAQGSVPADECYASCQLDMIRRTYGRYLVEFPRGKNAEEAVLRAGQIAEQGAALGCEMEGEAPRAMDLVETLRSSLVEVTAGRKQALLSHLGRIEGACAP